MTCNQRLILSKTLPLLYWRPLVWFDTLSPHLSSLCYTTQRLWLDKNVDRHNNSRREGILHHGIRTLNKNRDSDEFIQSLQPSERVSSDIWLKGWPGVSDPDTCSTNCSNGTERILQWFQQVRWCHMPRGHPPVSQTTFSVDSSACRSAVPLSWTCIFLTLLYTLSI